MALTLSGTVATLVATYRYGPFNEMFPMTNHGEDWIYIYNADDERMLQLKLGGSRFNRWTLRGLGNEVLREYLQVGDPAVWSVASDNVYRGGSLLATDTPSGVRHFHLDHLGTPRLVTNSGGAQVAFHAYYPFGEEATAFNQDTERMKFTGHERDLNSTGGAGDDLDYMRQRLASPVVARFLSTDVVLGDTALPQTWNRYSYGRSNPLRFVDPSGKTGLPFEALPLVLDALKSVGNLISGFGRGAADATKQPTLPGSSAATDTDAFNSGQAAASFLANNDTVVEASVSVSLPGPPVSNPTLTAGVATVNGSDSYVFGGVGVSQSVLPVSFSLSVGLVANYQGAGSYGGPFVAASGPAPVGLTIAGNPTAPRGASSGSVAVSTDLGFSSQTLTWYVPLSSGEVQTSSTGAWRWDPNKNQWVWVAPQR